MSGIYTDNGAARGFRTRLFRDRPDGSGVEWTYAVDYAAGESRWYLFHPMMGPTIKDLIAQGMVLAPYDQHIAAV